MNEWQVLRNGEVWNDRFDSEFLAILNLEECSALDDADYVVTQMTDEEMNKYK